MFASDCSIIQPDQPELSRNQAILSLWLWCLITCTQEYSLFQWFQVFSVEGGAITDLETPCTFTSLYNILFQIKNTYRQ
jgi:hypothetical protein